MANRDVSSARKLAFYLGIAFMALGFILFLSVLFSGSDNFGNFHGMRNKMDSDRNRAVAGIVCIVLGQFLKRLGHSGVAGSGLKLDPQQAREEMEPWSRMSGGMLKDTLDEAGIDVNRSNPSGELAFDEQLRRLESLKRDGLISAEEYSASRKKILDSVGK
jgi:hypothetical protein